MAAPRTVAEFLAYTKPVGDCLEWQRALNTDGYARAFYDGDYNGKVHRIVFALSNPGVDIQGLNVRHSCDNPVCINPAHLLAGTVADNMRDRDVRGRHGFASFNAEQVREIRELLSTGEHTQQEIADMFDGHVTSISQIKRNTTYLWVD